jgi:acyl-CoA synthetase (NDP forming)/L-amino acid N-acyltransferase YncA
VAPTLELATQVVDAPERELPMNRQDVVTSPPAQIAAQSARRPRPVEPSPADALAADGSCIRIRPVTPADIPALLALHEGASDRSRYLRFFTGDPNAARRFVDDLFVDGKHSTQTVLVAERAGVVVGMGVSLPMNDEEAEIAFLVADNCHGLGLGTLLLEQLASIARERGIHRFHADVLRANSAMLGVFADSGFAQRDTPEGPTTTIVIDTALDDRAIARITERERLAERKSLGRLLYPHSVAVIGAGRNSGTGHEVVRNLLEGGFRGPVFPVNPNADEICDRPALPSIGAAPQTVDLAVIALPADQVLEAVKECAAAGVGAVVIVSSGLGEAGPEGRRTEAEIVEIARRSGMRVVGPNCLGVVNTRPSVRLNASFGLALPPSGGFCLASQSGAVGIAVLDHAGRTGLGVGAFVSLGNKADVSGNDLLLEWWRDARVDVIGLYLESLGNPRRFARLAKLVAADKPILVVKGGRSPGGRRAGASHTAAAATPDRVLDALFASSGVIRLDTLPEMLDVARLLSGRPLPGGKRLAVLGNAGGGGILAADSAAQAGLEVDGLSPEVVRALSALAPVGAEGNPLDLGAMAAPDTLAEAVRIVAGSGEVDMVLAIVAATRSNDAPGALEAVARAAAEFPDVPLTLVALGNVAGERVLDLGDVRVPVFDFPETAVRALGHVARYAAWRRRPVGVVPHLANTDLAGARSVLDAYLTKHHDGGWMPPFLASTFLRRLGIEVAAGITASDPDEAEMAAAQVGYPVVAKTASPDIVHKTDLGVVRTDLRTSQDVWIAYRQIAETTGDERVLLQPLVRGVELLIGLMRDPDFGPVVVAASGGTLTQLAGDRTCRGLPLTDTDAAEMIAALRADALLDGYRGGPAADRGAVIGTLLRVALIAERFPEIAELDLNPVMAGPHGAVAVDARIRVVPAGPDPDPYRRRLGTRP